PLPGRDEATLGQSLGENDVSRAVPEEHLRGAPPPTHEDEDPAVEYVRAHRHAHHRGERVERLAHVDGLAVHPDPHRTRQRDHPSLRTSSATSAIVAPSIRSPAGPCTIRVGEAGRAGTTSTSRNLLWARRVDGDRSFRTHLRSVVALTPSSFATLES